MGKCDNILLKLTKLLSALINYKCFAKKIFVPICDKILYRNMNLCFKGKTDRIITLVT